MQMPTSSKFIYLHSFCSKDPPSCVCQEAAQAGQTDVILTLEPDSPFSNHF